MCAEDQGGRRPMAGERAQKSLRRGGGVRDVRHARFFRQGDLVQPIQQ